MTRERKDREKGIPILNTTMVLSGLNIVFKKFLFYFVVEQKKTIVDKQQKHTQRFNCPVLKHLTCLIIANF